MPASAPELEVYLSFEEAPDDGLGQDIDSVGDNSLLVDAPWANPALKRVSPRATRDLRNRLHALGGISLSATPPHLAARRIVPHPRDLHGGKVPSVGWDVYALQRALSVAGLRKWGTFTRVYGRATVLEVREFQRKHGLDPDGVYGVMTHRKLGPFYDARGVVLINRVHVVTLEQLRKAHLLSAAQILYNRRGIVHYTQGPARMWIVRHRLVLAQLELMSQDWEDCSSSVTGLRSVAGLSDPNGMDFDGFGFTGTMAEHGESVPIASATVGDCYLYGTFPYYHVTMNVGPNRCFSHGSEAGPSLETPFFASIGNCRRYPGLPLPA